MLFEYIENLRKKSPEARKTFAFAFTFGVTGLIVAIWIGIMLINNFGRRPVGNQDLEQKTIDTKVQNVSTQDLFNDSNVFLNDPDSNSSVNSQNDDWVKQLNNIDTQ